jgi:hypothetical protein
MTRDFGSQGLKGVDLDPVDLELIEDELVGELAIRPLGIDDQPRGG